jgi:hypothetical protein
MLAAGLVVAGCQSGKKSSAASSAAAVSSAAAASSAAASAAAGSGAASSGPASSGSAGSGSAPAVGGKPGYGIDPLTGAPAASAAAAKRPALAVKVDNVLGAWPQAGLNQADIVYDIPVEGGLTRLLAIFHSQDVALIGPIRSARPVDADLLHQYGHSYFAFSGGTASDLGPIENHSLATPMWWDVTPSLFVTRSDHAVPHQVFHYYVRDQNGHPDLLIDGTQVSSTNVVIMSVAVTNTSAHDSHGTVVPLPLVIGAGTAWIFRGGTVVKGTWSRPSENSETTFKVGSSVMSLAPGRTWVEILPNSTQPRIS